MKKFILLFAVAGLSIAAAKSYDVTFTSTTVLGAMEVPAGQYQLKYEGSKVTLISSSNGKRVETDEDFTLALLDDGDPLSRGAAVWAASRLAQPAAIGELARRHRNVETSSDVMEEWRAALAS